MSASKPPITDSPWLWFALFTGVGLVFLLATGGKFGNRQAQVERKGQAQAAAAGALEITEDAAGRKTAKNVPEYSKPGETKVRLVPLAMVLGTICLVCVVMFVRELAIGQEAEK